MPTMDGHCPFATQKPITQSGNFEVGRSGQRVKAVVLHIGEGPLTAFFPTFNNPAAQGVVAFYGGETGRDRAVCFDQRYGVGERAAVGQWDLAEPARDRGHARMAGADCGGESESVYDFDRA